MPPSRDHQLFPVNYTTVSFLSMFYIFRTGAFGTDIFRAVSCITAVVKPFWWVCFDYRCWLLWKIPKSKKRMPISISFRLKIWNLHSKAKTWHEHKTLLKKTNFKTLPQTLRSRITRAGREGGFMYWFMI